MIISSSQEFPFFFLVIVFFVVVFLYVQGSRIRGDIKKKKLKHVLLLVDLTWQGLQILKVVDIFLTVSRPDFPNLQHQFRQKMSILLRFARSLPVLPHPAKWQF